MYFEEFAPAPNLSHAVDRYWFLEGVFHAPERIFPDAHCELAIHLGDPVRDQSASLWIGQLAKPIEITPTGRTRVFGVRFKPEAAALAAPLAEGIVDLSGLFPRVSHWRDSLGEAKSSAEMAPLADKFLEPILRRLRPDARIAHAAQMLAGRAVRMDELSRVVGLGNRQLERQFKFHTGFEPKLYARICRFQHALALERSTPLSWAAIAADCGYYDQAHLIADFKEFSGATPAARPASEIGERLAARR